MVVFEDHDAARACDTRIKELKEEVGWTGRSEFHFSKNSERIREVFLGAVAPFDFSCHVFALNKDPEVLWGPGFNVKESLYKYAAGLTVENALPYLSDAKIVPDKTGDRTFRNQLVAYLKRSGKETAWTEPTRSNQSVPRTPGKTTCCSWLITLPGSRIARYQGGKMGSSFAEDSWRGRNEPGRFGQK